MCRTCIRVPFAFRSLLTERINVYVGFASSVKTHEILANKTIFFFFPLFDFLQVKIKKWKRRSFGCDDPVSYIHNHDRYLMKIIGFFSPLMISKGRGDVVLLQGLNMEVVDELA